MNKNKALWRSNSRAVAAAQIIGCATHYMAGGDRLAAWCSAVDFPSLGMVLQALKRYSAREGGSKVRLRVTDRSIGGSAGRSSARLGVVTSAFRVLRVSRDTPFRSSNALEHIPRWSASSSPPPHYLDLRIMQATARRSPLPCNSPRLAGGKAILCHHTYLLRQCRYCPPPIPIACTSMLNFLPSSASCRPSLYHGPRRYHQTMASSGGHEGHPEHWHRRAWLESPTSCSKGWERSASLLR